MEHLHNPTHGGHTPNLVVCDLVMSPSSTLGAISLVRLLLLTLTTT
jgi:hypothetical protein